MTSNIKFLFNFLNSKQKERFFSLLIIMIFSSFFEIISILSLVEYVNFLSENKIGFLLDFIYQKLELDHIELNIKNFSFFLILIFLLSTILNLFSVYLLSKFTLQTGGEIESSLFEYYLRRDYLFHLETTSSILLNNIFELVKRITSFVMYPLMIILSKILFILPSFFGLLVFKTQITSFTMLIFAGLYVLIFQLFRKKLKFLGELHTKVTEDKFTILNQGFGGIKEVKILNKFHFFKKYYDFLYNQLVSIQVQRDIVGRFPKYLIELIVISASILLILYFSNNLQFNFNEIIINLSFFLIIAYKIIPALQQVYYNANIVKNHLPAVSKLSKDLENSKKKISLTNKSNQVFKNFVSLEVKDLFFNYKSSKNQILSKINLKIFDGQKIAITGLSGSGKTTLINILLGIINLNKGKIIINNEILKRDNLLSWQKLIGFVSQSIFLTERSIKENIAFGIPKNKIDNSKVRKLIRICNLDKVVKNLPKKENTLIGERGAKFSGGQQQRLGIARALYTDPSVIILDEATNSLDLKTENEIFKSILNFKKNITIIMISHRLELIKKFDKVLFLDQGKIEGFDSYNLLYKNNSKFRELASNRFKELI